MAYTRVNWQNSPSHATPLSAENLNVMDAAIEELDGAVTDAEGTISTLESTVSDQATTISGLQTTVGEHTADIGNMEDDISDLQTTVSGHTTSISGLQTTVNGHTTSIGTLANLTTTDKDNLVEAINEVNADVSDVKEDLEQTQTQLDETTALALAALPQETIENVSIANFNDGAEDVPVKELKVGVEPIQSGSGDPSPTNVRPISGRDSVTVTRTGVNVWDEEWEVGGVDVDTGATTILTDRIRSKGLFHVLPNTEYYFESTFSSDFYIQILMFDANQTYLGRVDGYRAIYKNHKFTTAPNCHYVMFGVDKTYGTTYNNDISINYPSTEHDYHAYEGDSYPISLSSTIYGGTLEVETGVLTVTHGFIESYNGETLPSTWISDRDVYAEGTTPTTGAEVVYALATPTTVQLTSTQVTTLLKDNNIFADSGDIVKLIYRADLGAYIEKLINA